MMFRSRKLYVFLDFTMMLIWITK